MKFILNPVDGCYYSVYSLLCSCRLSKNWQINIYKTVVLCVVLYAYEIWSLTLKEEPRSRVLGRVFISITEEVTV
jgi:hypothetical protein